MNISAFLIDIDGTLYQGEQVVPGAPEALEFLRGKGIPFLLVTNTTRMPKSEILARLKRLGFRVEEREVFPVPEIAISYLQAKKTRARCFMMADPGIAKQFRDAGFEVFEDERPADFVIISYFQWISFGQIDIAFRLIREGAEAVALHRDPTLPEGGKLHVSLGPVVAAVQSATGRPVTIVGKPSARFFDLSLARGGFEKSSTIMIGDNYEGDVKGAIQAGLRAIQVLTGSYDERHVTKGGIAPTWTLPSIAQLPEWVSRQQART